MARIVTISSSPSAVSRTEGVLSHVARRLTVHGHDVVPIVLRDLPADGLMRADTTSPAIARAVAELLAADAVVVTTPVYKAAYSGLLKVFFDLLPQDALRGKSVLPIVTGGTAAHVLAIDYGLRPVLVSLAADHVGQGWFVLASQVELFPEDGGVLLDPAAGAALANATRSFVGRLGGRAAGTTAPQAKGEPVARRVRPEDPALRPLLDDLIVEYGTRYGRPTANSTLTEVEPEDFTPERGGAFVLLERDGAAVAGGAIRRHSEDTAEVKRVWTAAYARRQGLARRVLEELELEAARLGYRRIHLTTGPRQPEARALYLAAGYTAGFDPADPPTEGPLPFAKEVLPISTTAGSRSPWRAA